MRRNLFQNIQGNLALASAAAMVPVAFAVALAIDHATIARVRAELQHGVDSAALAIAREGPSFGDREARDLALQFVKTNVPGVSTVPLINRSSTRVQVTAKSQVKLAFGGLFGYDHWQVGVNATADVAMASYEIALVLDTTGSMQGGKLASMQSAVIGLLDLTTSKATDPEKLKFAVVPYATFVNVGPHHAPEFDKKGHVKPKTGAPWLDLKGKSPITQVELKKGVSRFEVFNNLGVAWAGCVETRPPTKKMAHDVSDSPPNAKDPASLFVPALSIDEPDTPEFENSYIASDADPLDKSPRGEAKKLKKYGLTLPVSDDDDDDDDEGGDSEATWAPVEASVTTQHGPNRGCDMQPIQPLTTDYDAVRATVGALVASGTTNIMEGVAWGWRVLSPGEPFGEGAEKTSGVRKVMILLTDGANNFGPRNTVLGSSYSSFGFLVDERLGIGMTGGATTAAMDAKTLAACTNAKADGVEIYTIRLEEPDVKTGMMLKECASSPDHFFDAPSRTQLDDVFSAIGKDITGVRLSS